MATNESWDGSLDRTCRLAGGFRRHEVRGTLAAWLLVSCTLGRWGVDRPGPIPTTSALTQVGRPGASATMPIWRNRDTRHDTETRLPPLSVRTPDATHQDHLRRGPGCLRSESERLLDELNPAEIATADRLDDLRAIRAIIDDREDYETRLTDAVRTARRNGRSWGEIARALGVTKQSAHARYDGVVESPAP
jgi:hypothetical protein